MEQLRSHLVGDWHQGQGDPIRLRNPATEAPVAEIRAIEGLASAVAHGRKIGGENLRRLSFAARGEILSRLGKVMHAHRDELIGIAVETGGNTRGDAKFDIDGAAAVLAAYAELAAELGDQPWIVDGDAGFLIRSGKVRAQHVLLPRRGLAVHINAFNFPAWGMVGKLAVSLLAGMPVLSKPATSTASLAHRIAQLFLEGDLLPEGSFQLLMGPAGDLLDHLHPQDVVAFTGSAATGTRIFTHPTIRAHNVKVNIEADSINAVVVGPDVEPGSELFDLVVRDCVIEMTQKAGQKCTATRRILVAKERLEAVREAVLERLSDLAGRTGNPADPDVRMGPLATEQQRDDARSGIGVLARDAKILRGDPKRGHFVGVEDGQGYFIEPILLEASEAAAGNPQSAFHHTEVFGPVATLLPFDGTIEQAAQRIGHGHGSLVSTLYSDDRGFLKAGIESMGPHLGRLVIADEKNAAASLSPGCVFPQVIHGGPGRAGSGAELGGRHGLKLYMQHTSIQGGASLLAKTLER